MNEKRPKWADEMAQEIKSGIAILIREGIGSAKKEIGSVKKEMRVEVSALKVEISEMKLDIRSLGVGMEEMKDEIKILSEHQMDMKRTLDEHTVILNDHTEMIGVLMVGMTSSEGRTSALEKSRK